jgi:hypothetical protein
MRLDDNPIRIADIAKLAEIAVGDPDDRAAQRRGWVRSLLTLST